MRGPSAPRALLALGVLALALHAHVLAGEAMVAWDLTAGQAFFARPGVARAWNPTLQDTVVGTWPFLLRDARDQGAAWNPSLALGHPASVADAPLASYPPGWLCHRLLPTGLAQGLLALLHTWGVGAAVFLHLRWRGVGPRAALAGAITAGSDPARGELHLRVPAGTHDAVFRAPGGAIQLVRLIGKPVVQPTR